MIRVLIAMGCIYLALAVVSAALLAFILFAPFSLAGWLPVQRRYGPRQPWGQRQREAFLSNV